MPAHRIIIARLAQCSSDGSSCTLFFPKIDTCVISDRRSSDAQQMQDELIKRTVFQIWKDLVELPHSATSKTARVLHGAMYSKLAQDSPAADLAAAPAAPAAPAPAAAGDAGGDGADSPTGRRPGYKQQLDPGRQQMHPDVGRARMGPSWPGWGQAKNGKSLN